MFKFGFSQKLASLCFMAVSVAVLLGLNLPAAAAVNSPTLTILDMEEMSQIAGAGCKQVLSTSGGGSGSCRPDFSPCSRGQDCGTNPYIIIYGQEYCQDASTGYDECWCQVQGHGWQMWNCQNCIIFYGNVGGCMHSYSGSGGHLIQCTVSTRCP